MTWGSKICTFLFVQIHLALTQCGGDNPGWNYAPAYFIPYIPDQTSVQYGHPVYYGPPQHCSESVMQCYSPQATFGQNRQDTWVTERNFESSYGIGQSYYVPGCGSCVETALCPQAPYSFGSQYYQGSSWIPEEFRTPYLQANGEPVILIPESNRGVKYVPPVACDCTSPYPHLPPIIIINDHDDDDDLFDFDDCGRGGLSQILGLLLALRGSNDGSSFFGPPPPPPPPPPPTANWGNTGCCCRNCKCGSNDGDFGNEGSRSSNGGTITHITIKLPKSWGVSQSSN